MKCRYCGEEGHTIRDCNKGLQLNKLFDSLVKPNLSNMNHKDLQRIASLNNIKSYLSKKDLIIEITNLWTEKDQIRKRNILYDNTECSVCYEIIYKNNNTVLSCGHKYHFECILLALNKKLFCPMCRIDITFTQFKFNNEIYEDEDVITTDMVNILTNLNNMNNNMNVHEIIDVNNTINNDESLYNHNMSYNDSIANLKFAIYLYTCFKKHHQFFLFLFGLSILYTYFDTIIITISNNKTMEYMEYIDDIL